MKLCSEAAHSIKVLANGMKFFDLWIELILVIHEEWTKNGKSIWIDPFEEKNWTFSARVFRFKIGTNNPQVSGSSMES